MTVLAATACNPVVPPPVGALDYVTAALADDGSVAVAPVRCDWTGCDPGEWTSLGGNLTSLQIETLDDSSGAVAVLGLAPSRATWFRRGTCEPDGCTWEGWTKLGGNLSIVRADELVGQRCTLLAGRTWLGNVFEAKICPGRTDPWKAIGGKLRELAVDGRAPLNGSTPVYFGMPLRASSEFAFWNYQMDRTNGWASMSATLTDPVVTPTDWCGLSPGSRRLWCSNSPTRREFRPIGGTWARLDGGTTIGLADDGSVMDWNGGEIANYGGNMTEVAAEHDLAVAITTDGVIQYRTRQPGSGPWQDLDAP